MAEIRHLWSWRQNAKTWFSQKLSIGVYWRPTRSRTWAFKETVFVRPKSKMAEIRHLENRHDVIFFCRGWSDLDKIAQTGAEWTQYGGRLGEFSGMSSQSHLPHCRVPLPGEFNVMIPELRLTLQGAATWRIQWHVIPEPHATLHGAVTWRNQCHDHATLQGVIIASAILKIVFRHI